MFLHREIAISWKSSKHTLVTMPTNHSEIIVLYEASRECAWEDHPYLYEASHIIIYEDNAACVAQMQMGYVKTNYTKHISLKLFYSHQL
jgi:hypothetical protein